MRATDFVHSYFDAWNHRDPVAVADHLCSDGIYLDVAENAARSHDDLVVSLEEFFSEFSHRYELIGDILEGPNTIGFQYRMCPYVQGRKGADGQPIRGAEFVTLNGDAAATIYDYYDIPGPDRPVGVTRALAGGLQRTQSSKYAKSGLAEEQLFRYKARLEQLMQAEQAYLRPDLTLPNLARIIGCSVNHLSQVINAGFGTNFFDYLNAYRIEHAKTLLVMRRGGRDAILDIAFLVGFNSNSAFYAAFKKYVGQTPAQYRRTSANGDA